MLVRRDSAHGPTIRWRQQPSSLTCEMNVTLVIPAKNASRFVSQLLTSVSLQTTVPDRIVFVDDASDDDTAEVAANTAAALSLPLRVLAGRGEGPAAARNVGLRVATTDAVVFMDADDLLPPTAIEDQTKALRLRGASFGYERRFLDAVGPPSFDPTITSTDQLNPSPGGFAAYREVFDRTGPFPESGRADETIIWYDALLRSGVDIERIARVTRLRRLHDANFSKVSATTRSYAEGLKAVLDARRSRESVSR